MKLKAILTLFTLTCSAAVFAQTYKISGKLADTSGMPISALTVKLINGVDTLKKASDVYGSFSFENVSSSRFTLEVTGIGYKKYRRDYQFSGTARNIALPSIEMQRDYTQLADVVISQPPIVLKEDTVEYKADSFKTKPGAVVEDLLKKLPGVQVDKQGNVTAQGKSVTKVKVNGKDFFGSDAQTATKNLPADIVDKVQVIDDYGDQAAFSGMKTGDPDKVINLQLKKDKSQGYFTKLTAGAGTEERYTASATANYFNNKTQASLFANSNNTNTGLFNFNTNAGMGNMMRAGQSIMSDMGGAGALNSIMNSGDFGFLGSGGSNNGISTQTSIGVNLNEQINAKGSLYGSYVFADNRNFKNSFTGTQQFYSDSVIIGNSNSVSRTRNQSHRVYLNLDYKLDSFYSIKFSPNFTVNNGNSNSNTISDNYYQQTQLNGNNSISAGDSKSNNLGGNFILRRRFRRAGRTFSANFTFGNNKNDNQTETYTESLLNRGMTFRDTTDQLNNTNSKSYNYGVSLSYTEPLNKQQVLEFVYRYNRSYNRNEQENTYPDPPKFLPPNVQLNSNVDNDFTTHTIGANLRTTKKKYNYTLGLSGQPVLLESYNYIKATKYELSNRWNIIPIANFNYQFSRSKRLSIFYRGTNRQPQLSQLQDDYSNQLNIIKGNPDLKPEFSNTITANFNNFNFISGKVLFANLTYTQTDNKIVNDISGFAGAQTTTYRNTDGFYNLTGFYTYSKPYKNRKYIVTFTGTANYNNNISYTKSQKNTGKNWVLNQRFNFEYNLKDWLELGVGAGYTYNSSRFTLTKQSNYTSGAWVLSTNGRFDIPGGWILNFDMDYTLNNGLSQGVNANLAILNAYLEKQFFKDKRMGLRLSGFDLLKQNKSVNRSVSNNTITDTRTNLLTQYFMMTVSYRFSKFKGQAQQQNQIRMPGMRMF